MNIPGTHFHDGLSWPQGHGLVGRKYVTEISSDNTGNRSRDRPTSSANHYATPGPGRTKYGHDLSLEGLVSFSNNWCPPNRYGSNSSKHFLSIWTLKICVFYLIELIYFMLFAEETPIIYLHNKMGWSLQWRRSVLCLRQEVSLWQLLFRSAIIRLRPCYPCIAARHLISETRNINIYFIRICTHTKA